MKHARKLLLICFLLISSTVPVYGKWVILLSENGQCAPIGLLKSRLPNIGHFDGPYSFAAALNKRGYKSNTSAVPGLGSNAVRIDSPDLNFSVIFILQTFCR